MPAEPQFFRGSEASLECAESSFGALGWVAGGVVGEEALAISSIRPSFTFSPPIPYTPAPYATFQAANVLVTHTGLNGLCFAQASLRPASEIELGGTFHQFPASDFSNLPANASSIFARKPGCDIG